MKEHFSNEIFDQFFANSIDLLCIADTDGHFQKLNSEWEKTLGYTLKELEGQPFINFVHPDDVDETIQTTRQLANNQNVKNFINRYRHKNGSYRWIEWRSYPAGKMIYASARDITDRIEIEQALVGSEKRNKEILSLTTDYIFRLAVTGKTEYRLEYLSENFESVTGINRKYVFSPKSRKKYFHPDDFPKLQQFFSVMISDGKPGEIECRSVTGINPRWINIIAKPVIDPQSNRTIAISGAIKDITDRKNAEQQLKTSEEMFMKAFLCSPNAVSIASCTTGEYIGVNEVFLNQTGYTRQEVIGKNPADLNIWVKNEHRDTMLVKLKKKEQLSNFETTFRMKNGEIRDCLVTGEIIEVNHEKCNILYINDITDNKQVEEALRKSHARFQALVESQTDLISRYLPDSTLTYVNDAYCRFFGKKREELIGQTYMFMIAPEFQDIVRKQTDELVRNCSSVVGEYINYRFDGKPCWIQWAVQCIRDESGKVVELQAVGRDLSEIKNTEEALRNSERKYRQLFENMTSGFALHRMIYDEHGKPFDYRFIEANPAFERLTGLSSASIIGKTIKELFPTIEDNLIQTFGNVALTGNPVSFTNYAKNLGRYYDVFVFSPEKDQYAVIFNDATERINTENALRESESRLRSFINESSEGIAIINEKGLIEEWNNSAISITGLSKEETINQPWCDIDVKIVVDEDNNKDFKGEFEMKVRETLSSGKLQIPSHNEYKIRHTNGEVKTLEQNVFTIKSENGYRIAAIFNDITERIKTKNELRLTEEKFSLAFKTTPDAVNINRLSDGLFIEINQGFTDATGYTFEDLKGKTSLEINIWDDPADRDRLVKGLTENGKVANLEARFRRKDGSASVGLMSAAVITLQGEKCILTITRDITERNLIEEKLRISELRLKKGQALGRIGYTEYEPGSNEVWLSGEGMKIFGFSREEGNISMEDLKNCITGQGFQLLYKSSLNLVDFGKKYDIELTINPADGSAQKYIHTVSDLEKDSSGKPLKILTTFQDITERKKYEEALQKRVLALTKPLDDPEGIQITDLFDIEELQQIQDSFAAATGVASLITYPDGTPITKPGNFCKLCKMIRSTKKGEENCNVSDSYLGNLNPSGPIIHNCLSAGLQGAGASIVVGGIHIANWLIGQVRDPSQEEKEIIRYAGLIGMDRKQFKQALHEVPVMSKAQFEHVARSLYVFANELSLKAYQNIQQARFIGEQKRAEEALRLSEERFRGITQNIPGMVFQFYAGKNGEIGLNYVSDLSIKYLGIDNKDLEGIFDLFAAGIDEGERDGFYKSTKEAISSVSPWEWEGRYTKPGGEKKYLRGVSQPRMMGDQLVFDGVVLDITERKLAEEALRKGEEQLRGITQNVPGIVYQLILNKNRESRLNYIGESSMRYAGLDSHDPDVLQRFFERFDEEDRKKIFNARDKAFETMSSWEWDGRYSHPDGSIKYFHGLSQPRRVDEDIVFDGIIFDITSTKQAEKELADLRAMMETAFRQTPIPMVIVSAPDNIVRLTNKACYEILGYGDETSFVGKSLLELDQMWQDYDENGNSVPIEAMPLALALHGIETKNKEYSIRRKDGSIRWESVSSTPVRNREGEIIAAYLVFPDITEKRKSEEKIKQLAALHQTILDTASAGLLFVRDRKMQWANNSFCTMFGYGKEEFIDLDTSVLYAIEDEFIKVGVEGYPLLSGGEVYTTEVVAKRKDGSSFWIELNGKAIDPQKYAEGSIWMIMDITVRKNAEEKFKQLAGLHQTILDTVSVGLTFVQDRKTHWANAAFLRMFGYQASETFGSPTSILYAEEEDYKRVGLEAYSLLAKGEVYTTEFRARRKNGTEFWVSMNGKSIDPDKPMEGSIWMLLDIDEAKNTEQRFKQLADLNQTILETVTVGLAYTVGRKIQWSNSVFCKLFGYETDEIINSETSKLYKDEDLYLSIGKAAYESFTRNETYFTEEAQARRKNGTLFWVSLSAKAINPYKPMEGSIWMVHDITNRKKAEQSLKKSEAILKSTMESMSDGVLVVTKDGKATHFNTCFRELFSIPEEEVNAKDDEILLNYAVKKVVNPDKFYKKVKEIYKTNSSTEEVIQFTDGRIIERLSFPLAEESPVKGRVWLFRDITERKKSEDALFKSQKLLSESQRVAHIGCWENDHIEKKLTWNDETYKVYGFDNQNFKPTYESIGKLIHPDDRDLVNSINGELLRTGIFRDHEYRIICQDETIRTLFVAGAVSLNEDNKVYRSYGIVQDITERKKAEVDLRESQERLRTFMNSATDAITIWDKNMKLIDKNEAANKYLRINKSDKNHLGKVIFDFIPGSEDYDKYLNVMKTGKPFSGEEMIALTGHEKKWFNLRIFKVLEGIGVLTSDITEHKLAELEIKEKEAKLRSIFFAAPVAIGLTIKRDFQECNDAFYTMTGYKPEEIIGKNARMIYPTGEEFLHVGREQLRQMKEQSTDTLETRWLCKDGKILNILLRFVALDQTDLLKGVTFTAMDITDRKTAEEELKKLNAELEERVYERTAQLQQVNKDLESFGYSVSHDLRAPLRHIDGFIRLLYSKIESPSETIREYSEKIQISSKRMSDMIDELLKLSRLGRKELISSPVDLNFLIKEVIEQFKPDFTKRKINWVIGQLPTISGDQSLLRIAFENIISNAIKYTSKKLRAIIEIGISEASERKITIYIKDNGAGFDMAYSEKLFGVFQRLHSSDNFEGIGIGLAIVKQIIEKHKGMIKAEGKINKGAIFYITLPLI